MPWASRRWQIRTVRQGARRRGRSVRRGHGPRHSRRLVRDGRVPESRIDLSAQRLLALMFRLGIFENPMSMPIAPQRSSAARCPGARRRCAAAVTDASQKWQKWRWSAPAARRAAEKSLAMEIIRGGSARRRFEPVADRRRGYRDPAARDTLHAAPAISSSAHGIMRDRPAFAEGNADSRRSSAPPRPESLSSRASISTGLRSGPRTSRVRCAVRGISGSRTARSSMSSAASAPRREAPLSFRHRTERSSANGRTCPPTAKRLSSAAVSACATLNRHSYRLIERRL